MYLDIYKFGGTALSTKKNFETLYNIIKSNNNKKIIVVSAMGRSGFPYSTDSLLSLINPNYISNDEYHHLLANGEIISSLVFNNYLKENGINAKCVSYLKIGITINNNSLNLDNTYLQEYLKKYDCLVIPGFIGKDNENEVVTLGRGSSDLTAILCAEMFSIKNVYLFKDVDGIYPFIHYPLKKVKPYEYLTSKELRLLLKNGVNAVSIDALDRAESNNTNIHVLPFNSYKKGTTIEVSDKINNKVIGLIIENKTFKIVCSNPEQIQKEMHQIFTNSHALTKKEEVTDYCFSFVLKSSQNLLLKRKIIDFYFHEYFLD